MSLRRSLPALLLLASASVVAPEPLVAPVSAPPAAASTVSALSAAASTVSALSTVAALPPAVRFRWPLDGTPVVVRRFDPPPRPWLAGHRGVDLAALPGSRVRAAGAGVVRFAGTVAGRGVVSVDHPGGLRTTYEPVTPSVGSGDRVAAGEPLGLLVAGHPGCPVSACLHWGLRRGRDYLDPLAMLGLARVRLLPVPARRRVPTRRRTTTRRRATTRPNAGGPAATPPVRRGQGHRSLSRGGRPSASRSYSSAWL